MAAPLSEALCVTGLSSEIIYFDQGVYAFRGSSQAFTEWPLSKGLR